MKLYSCRIFAAFSLMALGLVAAGCRQAPPAASTAPAAPASTTTVVEEVHHDRDDRDAPKMQNRNHPDDAARRDHPDDNTTRRDRP